MSTVNDDAATGTAALQAAAVAAAEPTPVVEPAAPAVVEPATYKWTKDITERFTDEAVRAQVNSYLLDVQQPYITKLEMERADAAAKTWVHDQLNERPESLSEIAEQLYPGLGEQVAALITSGATPEVAVAAAAVEADPEEIGLDQLPKDVREAVEFARTSREREATEAAAKTQADAEAAAAVELKAWQDTLVAEQPDVKPTVLLRYVASANVPDGATSEQLYAQALADYRVDFPAPAGAAAPATLPGGRNAAATGEAPAPPKTMQEALDRIWAAAADKP